MHSITRLATKTLKVNAFGFASFGKKRKPTPADLEKYDVVVVGAGLGSVLATHLDAVVGEKAKIFVSYDNPITQYSDQRNIYEQGLTVKFASSLTTRQIVSKNVAQSDYVGVDKFYPEKSEVLLKNGRTIKYENLVIATGQKQNYQEIKGFDDAWADLLHPFYTNSDHPSWRSTANKGARVHNNFNGGDAIFYIPPNNFTGEIQDYNFFASKQTWNTFDGTGKISWDTSKLTVINPNKTFSKHFPKANDFINQRCHENNINIETDLELVEVKRNDSTAIFRNKNNQLVERRYNHFYSLMPTTTHANLKEAGLSDATGYLDVNAQTLQHKKYENIFGLGDVSNVPTTKSFYGGLNQVAVIRHNLERKLNGLSLNAKYDGYSQVSMLLGTDSLASIAHTYNGVQSQFSTDGLSAALRYKLYTTFGKHRQEGIMKFKSWGPPYYKIKKSFDNNESVPTKTSPELTPEKKTA